MFTPAIFHASHLVQPSDRGECELLDAIVLFIQSNLSIDVLRLDGWRIDVAYPGYHDCGGERLLELVEEDNDAEVGEAVVHD